MNGNVKVYRVESGPYVVQIKVDDRGMIVDTAPVFKVWCGQPYSKFLLWLVYKFGPVTEMELK